MINLLQFAIFGSSNNLEKYKPSENLTIDEQLFSYSDKMRLTQFMSNKPVKYGGYVMP